MYNGSVGKIPYNPGSQLASDGFMVTSAYGLTSSVTFNSTSNGSISLGGDNCQSPVDVICNAITVTPHPGYVQERYITQISITVYKGECFGPELTKIGNAAGKTGYIALPYMTNFWTITKHTYSDVPTVSQMMEWWNSISYIHIGQTVVSIKNYFGSRKGYKAWVKTQYDYKPLDETKFTLMTKSLPPIGDNYPVEITATNLGYNSYEYIRLELIN
jgi:hypothetical protein